MLLKKKRVKLRLCQELIQWGRSAKSGKSKLPNVTVLQQFKLYLDDKLEGIIRQPPLELTSTDIIAGKKNRACSDRTDPKPLYGIDYLQKFFNYVKIDMTKKGFQQGFENQVRFCLTVSVSPSCLTSTRLNAFSKGTCYVDR